MVIKKLVFYVYRNNNLKINTTIEFANGNNYKLLCYKTLTQSTLIT